MNTPRKHVTRYHLIVFTLAVFMPAFIFAENDSLKQGLAYHEVIEVLGAPKEKVEFESSRTMDWIYPDQKLHFKAGKLESWTSSEVAVEESDLAFSQEDFPEPSQDQEIEVKDILNEIISDGAESEESGKRPSRRSRRR